MPLITLKAFWMAGSFVTISPPSTVVKLGAYTPAITAIGTEADVVKTGVEADIVKVGQV